MTIIATIEELIELGVWPEYCEMNGVNEWVLSEDIIEAQDEVQISWAHGLALGLIESDEC